MLFCEKLVRMICLVVMFLVCCLSMRVMIWLVEVFNWFLLMVCVGLKVRMLY